MDIAALGTSPYADAAVGEIRRLGLQENVVELAAYGFTVIPPEKTSAPADFTERLRDVVLRIHSERNNEPIDDYRTASVERAGENNWWLVEEDDAIVEAIINPAALAMARWLCGQSTIMAGASSIVKPGNEENRHHLPMHNDNHGVPPPMSQYAHWCNTSWVLTDYREEEDGPTVFIPGSHLFGRAPLNHEAAYWKAESPYQPLPLRAEPGSLAVWHGATWHGSLPRTKPGLRVTLVLSWMRSYMQGVNQYKDAIDPALVERFPELTKVLGLERQFPFRENDDHHERLFPVLEAGRDQFA